VDTLHFTNCVFTADTPYYWQFNASHDADADVDFTGSTVVGATVTLRSTVSLSGLAFINCPTFTQNSAVLGECTFTGTKVTSATLGDMDNISGCSFTSGGTGHAIEVSGSASTITFSGNTFTGYAGSNGSTGNEAIYINIAAGTVTLNISGGDTPSIRTAGATVVVNNAVTVTIEAQVSLSGAEIRIYDLDNSPAGSYGTELAGTESCGTATYGYSGSVGNSIEIQIMLTGYVEYTQQYTLPATSVTLTISLKPELNS
jgi:hypothetical protein